MAPSISQRIEFLLIFSHGINSAPSFAFFGSGHSTMATTAAASSTPPLHNRSDSATAAPPHTDQQQQHVVGSNNNYQAALDRLAQQLLQCAALVTKGDSQNALLPQTIQQLQAFVASGRRKEEAAVPVSNGTTHAKSSSVLGVPGHHEAGEWCEVHFTMGCKCKEGRGTGQVVSPVASEDNPHVPSSSSVASTGSVQTVETSATQTPRVVIHQPQLAAAPMRRGVKPKFQFPPNPGSHIMAHGWVEQQRRSKMRTVWKEVWASLVEGRKPGEETTLWIQREVGKDAKLEPLHQIPLKWIVQVSYLQHSPDQRFAIKAHNLTEDFIFRCMGDEEAAQNWVLTLRSALEAALSTEPKLIKRVIRTTTTTTTVPAPASNNTAGPTAPTGPVPANNSAGPTAPTGPSPTSTAHAATAAQPPPAASSSLPRMSVSEMRAIAHGEGCNTLGMERGELEAVVAKILAARANPPVPQHARSASSESAASAATPPPPSIASTASTDTAMSISQLRAVAHGHGIRTVGMERGELEAVVAQIQATERQRNPPPPPVKPATATAASTTQKKEPDEARRGAASEEARKAAAEEAQRKAEVDRQQRVAARVSEQRETEATAMQRAREQGARRAKELLEREAEERRRREEAAAAAQQQQREEEERRQREEAAAAAAAAALQQRESEERRQEEEERQRLAAERLRRDEEEIQRRAAEQQAAEKQRRDEEERRKAQEAYRQQQAAWLQQEEQQRKLAEQQAEARRQQEEMYRRQQQQQWQQPQQRPPPPPAQQTWQQQSAAPGPPPHPGFPQQQWQQGHAAGPGQSGPPPAGWHQQQHAPPRGPPQHPGAAAPQTPPRPPAPSVGGAPPPPPVGSPISAKYAKMANQDNDDGGVAMQKIKHGILVEWALQPPTFQVLRPIEVLITSVHAVFPPKFGIPGHSYFGKWAPITPGEVFKSPNGAGGPDAERLSKAVRKLRFFLHPDKLPRDLTTEQQFACKMVWDITTDAFEEHKKQEEDLGWIKS
jgi:hypothetical protein